MKKTHDFELVEVADENLVIPIGDKADTFHGVISLNEEAAFLLKHIDDVNDKNELLHIILNEYDVEEKIAISDIERMCSFFLENGVIEE